jgi:hypothetical protein
VNEGEVRDPRIASWLRGVFIAALIVAYGWLVKTPQASMTASFLVALVLQVLIVTARRFVPEDAMPQAQEIFEMVADGVSVLMFALGVFGGLRHLVDAL